MHLNVKPYVTAEDVPTGTKFKIVSEGNEVEKVFKNPNGTEDKKVAFEIEIDVKGIVFVYSMNDKSQANWIRKYGIETKKWIGKRGVTKIVTQNVFGTMRDIIYSAPAKNGEIRDGEDL